MDESLATRWLRHHRGTHPFAPGPPTRVITGVVRHACGATINGVKLPVVAAADADAPARPPFARPRSGRVLAGVGAGTAAHLRQDPLLVRVVLVVLAITGVGVVIYGLLWLTMPVAEPGMEPLLDLSAAHRPSKRQIIGLAVLGFAGVSLISQTLSWGNGSVVLPLVLAVAGLAVVWRQLDADRTLAQPGVRWVLAGGIALAAAGVVLLLATTGQLANARNGFLATVILLVGITLVTAPLWRRLLDSRAAERSARIRSEERATVAAHLHDSVLQTLALIQRHADEPQAVSRLARSQERELRAWLYDPAAVREGDTWAGLVAGVVTEVETDHAMLVEPVVVGDAPVDEALAALGAATREALMNAAKHSGAATADLYTEVTPERVSVFVRDRGAGFDLAAVPDDRRGLRDSVQGRLVRLGGTAEVRSAPGEGTEVELVLPRTAA